MFSNVFTFVWTWWKSSSTRKFITHISFSLERGWNRVGWCEIVSLFAKGQLICLSKVEQNRPQWLPLFTNTIHFNHKLPFVSYCQAKCFHGVGPYDQRNETNRIPLDFHTGWLRGCSHFLIQLWINRMTTESSCWAVVSAWNTSLPRSHLLPRPSQGAYHLSLSLSLSLSHTCTHTHARTNSN